MATGYNSTKTGLFFDAETAGGGVTLADGKTYNAGDLKPTWVEVGNQLGMVFEDKYQGNSASKEFDYWKEQLDQVDMVSGTALKLTENGEAGSLVNIGEYLDMMPNFKAYLEKNPIVRLSITGNTDTGAIYFSPYFDGVNDIERMPLMRTDWVQKFLDGEGEFTAHAPEKYGIWQSVGDTVGPGGVLRAMRTVPLYEGFAKAIREYCPDAWVINLTNPMSICVKTLYRVFPEIKAFGCCHEVFHTQDFLCCVLKELTGSEATRRDIYTDASGINHFTWITEARYRDTDLLALLPEFMDRYFESGYYEHGPADQWKKDTFAYGNRVKMDLFRRYGALA